MRCDFQDYGGKNVRSDKQNQRWVVVQRHIKKKLKDPVADHPFHRFRCFLTGFYCRNDYGVSSSRFRRSNGFAQSNVIRPLVGGLLANPVPRLLPSSWTLFSDYPYLLPAFVTGLSATIAAWMSISILPEV